VEENLWAQINYLTLTLLGGLLALVLISFLRQGQKGRTVSLVAAIALVGFYHTNSLSSVNVVNILTYRLPTLAQNLFWYLLIGFTLFSCLIWGRLYCGFICPFGAILELLERINTYKLRFSQRLGQRAKYLKYVILWLVVVAALVLNDSGASDYEPFSTLFTQAGGRLDWALLILAIGGSLLIPRFFCRYLCGIGISLGLISKYSLKKLKVKDCHKCESCQAACPYGAIEPQSDGAMDINPVECIQCHICLGTCPYGSIGR
jgi:polyferredoxin